MVTAAMKLKDAYSLEESYDQPRQHIKKQRYYFTDKSPSKSKQELDYKESWGVGFFLLIIQLYIYLSYRI